MCLIFGANDLSNVLNNGYKYYEFWFIEYDYYDKIKVTFGNTYNSILWALKDSAIFSDILEEFENDFYFKNSLIQPTVFYPRWG